MALKDIKAKIVATKRMNTVTRAMEAVSAAKMRKTQEAAFRGRAYARAALAILARLSGSADVRRHTLTETREVKRVALVVITSDRGLAGALNSGVERTAQAAIAARTVADVSVFAYGRKGEEYFRNRGYTIARSFENRADDISLSAMEKLSSELSAGFLAGDFDEVIAVYSDFRTTFEQVPTVRTLLPLSLKSASKIAESIRPARGKWSSEVVLSSPEAYTIEPSANEVLSILIPRLVAVSLYFMLLEAKASEHSARMVAMKNASDKSKERTRDFTRLYNKLRQAAITREVSEIVGGREALAS
jgi:F-type H+-transporting ATPase subunit gamma